MLANPNALQWDRRPGHYEVHYLTLTDPASGIGLWIRYTMVAPLPETGEDATCSVWFVAIDPRPGQAPTLARKATFPIDELHVRGEPFELRIGDAVLTDAGASGALGDVAWELRWQPAQRHYEHVHAALRAAKLAQTVLVLPHADIAISGSVTIADTRLELSDVPGAQAHLWGSKHAQAWAWAHCNDFETLDGERVRDTFVDGVSVFISRFGRTVGPNTPVVARIDGRDFISTAPLRVLGNDSTFALTGWRFTAIDGRRKLIGEVDADRSLLAGVTYHDPDGELAYCYNGETATMRLHVYERARQVGGWAHRRTLIAPGRAHFEYAQRTPVPDLDLLTT